MDPSAIERDIRDQCLAELALASSLLDQGCEDLRRATGLALDPLFVAESLRVPELADPLCERIENACRDLGSSERALLAKTAVDAICSSALALRRALERIASIQGANAKAISAYHANL